MSVYDLVKWYKERQALHPLDRVLTSSERAELVGYFDDLLLTGHTPRQAIEGLTGVWAEQME